MRLLFFFLAFTRCGTERETKKRNVKTDHDTTHPTACRAERGAVHVVLPCHRCCCVSGPRSSKSANVNGNALLPLQTSSSEFTRRAEDSKDSLGPQGAGSVCAYKVIMHCKVQKTGIHWSGSGGVQVAPQYRGDVRGSASLALTSNSFLLAAGFVAWDYCCF